MHIISKIKKGYSIGMVLVLVRDCPLDQTDWDHRFGRVSSVSTTLYIYHLFCVLQVILILFKLEFCFPIYTPYKKRKNGYVIYVLRLEFTGWKILIFLFFFIIKKILQRSIFEIKWYNIFPDGKGVIIAQYGIKFN